MCDKILVTREERSGAKKVSKSKSETGSAGTEVRSRNLLWAGVVVAVVVVAGVLLYFAYQSPSS